MDKIEVFNFRVVLDYVVDFGIREKGKDFNNNEIVL